MEAIACIHHMNGRLIQSGEPAHHLAISVTGAGGHFGGLLTDVPGSSATLHRFSVDWDRAASSEQMGHTPSSYAYVNLEVATDLARGCLEGARRRVQTFGLPPPGVAARPTPHFYGVGLTGSIATIGSDGSGKVYLAMIGPDGVVHTVHATFSGSEWTRTQHNALCELFLLNLILYVLGLRQVEINERTFPGKLDCAQKSYQQNPGVFTLRPATSAAAA
jgi:nicotinamide mononucleotide (NMN) deamidase PncC